MAGNQGMIPICPPFIETRACVVRGLTDEVEDVVVAKRNHEEVGKEADEGEEVEGVEEREQPVQVEPMLCSCLVELLLPRDNIFIFFFFNFINYF